MSHFCAMFPLVPRNIIQETIQRRYGEIDYVLEDLLRYSENLQQSSIIPQPPINNIHLRTAIPIRQQPPSYDDVMNVVDTSNDEIIAKMMQNEEFRRFAASDRELRELLSRERYRSSSNHNRWRTIPPPLSNEGSSRIYRRNEVIENILLPVPNGPIVDYETDSNIPNGPVIGESSPRTSTSIREKITNKFRTLRKSSSNLTGGNTSRVFENEIPDERDIYPNTGDFEYDFKDYQHTNRVKEMGKASKEKIMKLVARFKATRGTNDIHYSY
uniref:CUE domain-containing protein n=1 Tax=Parastrongyloides trichosuri TaxID=131310 RepID=A0A0N5A181_PARTI